MKTKKIPTVFVLNLYSWAIAALGVLAGAYWIFFKANSPESLVSGVLIILGGPLCAVLIRGFGNVAQMMFDQGQKLEEVNQKLSLLEEIQQRLIPLDQVEEINRKLDQVEEINRKLDQMEEINRKLDQVEEINQKLVQLDRLQEIKQRLIPLDQMEEINRKLDQVEEINQKLVQLDRLQEIKQRLIPLDQMEEINRKLDPMEMLNQTSEKISCDSKDISQGIHQIKEFFERIQNHLDLNK